MGKRRRRGDKGHREVKKQKQDITPVSCSTCYKPYCTEKCEVYAKMMGVEVKKPESKVYKPIEPPCHTGITKAFSNDFMIAFGGSIFEVQSEGIAEFDVVIDAIGIQNVYINGEHGGMFMPETRKTVIRINWPDYHVPKIKAEWWRHLVLTLERLSVKLERKVKVLCCCHGGHGRTGTALTILAGMTKAFGDACPVTSLRAYYCRKAVESASQMKYIQDVAGIKINKTVYDKQREEDAWINAYYSKKQERMW